MRKLQVSVEYGLSDNLSGSERTSYWEGDARTCQPFDTRTTCFNATLVLSSSPIRLYAMFSKICCHSSGRRSFLGVSVVLLAGRATASAAPRIGVDAPNENVVLVLAERPPKLKVDVADLPPKLKTGAAPGLAMGTGLLSRERDEQSSRKQEQEQRACGVRSPRPVFVDLGRRVNFATTVRPPSPLTLA
jgi:hypothetical protein